MQRLLVMSPIGSVCTIVIGVRAQRGNVCGRSNAAGLALNPEAAALGKLAFPASLPGRGGFVLTKGSGAGIRRQAHLF